MDFLSAFISAFLSSIFFILFSKLAEKAGKKPESPDFEGWIYLKPHPFIYTTYILGITLMVMIFFFFLVIIFAVKTVSIFLNIFTLIYLIFLSFTVYIVFVVKIRFNEEGIEYRGVFRRIYATWGEIIAYSELFGGYVRTKYGVFFLSKFDKGFLQLVEKLKFHNIPNKGSHFV